MLNQNIKGFLTLLLIVGIITTLFYGYKGFIEPKFIKEDIDQLPLEPVEETKVTPKIEIYSEKAIVEWQTPYESSAEVVFSNKKEDCDKENNSCKKVKENNKKTEHQITLENLSPDTEYFYKIGIDGVLYPSDMNYFSFKTPILDRTANQNETVENSNTKNNVSEEKELTLEEFKQAMKVQDTKFDYNKDGKVTILDFSIYEKSKKNP